LAQVMLDCSIKIADGSSSLMKRVTWKATSAAVKVLGLSETLVHYDLYGRSIQIFAASGIPSVRSRFPNHCRNLQRIAAVVSSKYPHPSMIDVGANIGDTALTMRSSTDGPILCVEASQRYAALCRENLAGLANIVVVKAFVGTGSPIGVLLIERGGTGRGTADGTSVTPTITLAELAESYGFSEARLVKVDTDGFDGRVIQASSPWLKETKPVLFWEFELSGDEANRGPGERVFDILGEAGYDRFMFWTNIGDYVLTAKIEDRDVLNDLSFYLGRRENRDHVPPHYADVCAFSKRDADLCEAILRLERAQRG